MQVSPLPFDVVPSALFPPKVSPLVRPLDPVLTRFFFRKRMLQAIPRSDRDDLNAFGFAAEMLRNLDICYRVPEKDLAGIPSTGPVLVVANHPFGFLEGLLLLSVLEKVRPDCRIVANGILSSLPALRERVIFVNPFEDRARHENGKSLRAALDWLSAGGLLVMFPAGEVSHLQWHEGSVVDPAWNSAAARFARKLGCPTVPLFFDGANSYRFQIVGALHPRLRTLNLLNELLNKSSREIGLRLGTPIPASILRGFPDPAAATDYLRARTYLLRARSAPTVRFRLSALARPKPVATRGVAQLAIREIEALPADRLLASNASFGVYLAHAPEIPSTLREIGRCREMTYREAGEGTGRALDLDAFDEYYAHIVLWHFSSSRVAGAYRLAATPDVLPARGIAGLYSSTLFHYDAEFFQHIGPALELGRSFICRDYQKTYSPLLLLWKGILAYVVRRADCAVLFGPVSMSRDYHALSRALLVNFLDGAASSVDSRSSVSQWIRPRTAFRRITPLPKQVRELGRLLPSVEELSASIQDLESDRKGLPVLIRQYLKIGGRLLASNVDPRFSDALDVLVMADLRTAATPLLDRCLGRSAAAAFRAHHS